MTHRDRIGAEPVDRVDRARRVGVIAGVPVDDPVAAAYREHWGRLLAVLAAQLKRLDLAEDALSEAFVAATRTWPTDGVPRTPAAWLLTAARRRAMDRIRAEAMARRKLPLLIVDAPTHEQAATTVGDDGSAIGDERLRMMFTCCHPALAPDARAALTLRFVTGISTGDLARLFLVPEATMAARLTRAKRKIVTAGIPFTVPPDRQLAERLDTVATVIYLAFTAGYSAGSGPDLLRTELAGEAIRLALVLDRLQPRRPVVQSLLALMMLQHSRRDARIDADGSLVLLPDQDRARWHHDEIAAAVALLADLEPTTGLAEEYRLQALIAAEHATAPTAGATDWRRVVSLYADLEHLTGSPVVRLAAAVAVSESEGPAAGLAMLDGLDPALPHSHRLPAVRGELLLRLGRHADATDAFDAAIDRAGNDAERSHLEARRAAAAAHTP